MALRAHLKANFFSFPRLSVTSIRGVRTSHQAWHAQNHETSQDNTQNQETSQDQNQHTESSQEQSSTPPHEETAEDLEDGEQQLRVEILEASLPFVHSLGWSHEAIAQGAESLGYSGMAGGMFPGGGVDLVNHFYAACNARLDQVLSAKVLEMEENPELKKGTTAFIASAVETRLRMNIEYIDSWHQALALHARPNNAPRALHNLGTLVDHVWYHAGDRSHDFNWYTKRGILAAVYKSSELHLLQDKSEDFQATWAFVGRRLSDVKEVARCVRAAEGGVRDVGGVARAGLITAMNILGMNQRTR